LSQAKALWGVILESEKNGYREGNDLRQLLGPKAPQVKRFYEESPQKIAGGILDKASPMSLSIMEWAGSSGTIVCIPTGGASGIVPGVIAALCEEKGWGEDEAARGLLAAGMAGVFMAETDYFGGWGCQAEIGCGVGMAAAALTCLMGGTPKQCLDAASMGIQSLIGLVCDSVCGQSQVPCYLRNMTGTATAVACANAALAGLEALIPLDEMVTAMMNVGRASRGIRLNALGANGTPTGIRLEAEEQERQRRAVDEKLAKH
nr:L-serine ammonia-lyase, iron-sulfur-dependent, subunit alpha [Clostridia bacterium]